MFTRTKVQIKLEIGEDDMTTVMAAIAVIDVITIHNYRLPTTHNIHMYNTVSVNDTNSLLLYISTIKTYLDQKGPMFN